MAELTKKDTVLIYSGGMDSTVLLYQEHERIEYCLWFNYGQKHGSRELEMAWENANVCGLHVHEMDLTETLKTLALESSLVGEGIDVPDGHYADPTMRSTVVPFRNGVMLSLAVASAEAYGLRNVMYAAHAGDHAVYPDCRPQFYEGFRQAADCGTYVGVQLIAPYIEDTKTDIAERGHDLGVNWTYTWSCYKGGRHHCGTCGTCVERREALEKFNDPTVYIPIDEQ
tara:strand:+ start:8998 stop:9678 length:681 start_codon:yes stop_codon:yes gene_type:complete